MSSEAAKRWFVPDREWKATTEDWALVNTSSTAARKAFDEVDNLERRLLVQSGDKPPSFYNFYDQLRLRDNYRFLRCSLVYAYSGHTIPGCRQKDIDQAISEVPGERERAEIAAFRKQLEEALFKQWASKPHTEDYPYYRDRSFAMLEKIYDGGTLDEELMKFLFSVESLHDRRSFLAFISGHSGRTSQPRVLFLLGLIDTEQTTAMGVTEGYAIALDLAKDELMIKPLHSDKDTHPLTGIWRARTPNDDISCDGMFLCFAEYFAKLPRDGFIDQRLGFKLLIDCYVIKFFLDHWDALIRSRSRAIRKSNEFIDDLEKDVTGTYDDPIGLLKRIEFPVKKKLGRPLNGALNIYKKLERVMLMNEDEFRQEAISARESGQEKIAENAAKVYEKLLGTIRAFNERPSADI